MGRIQLIYRSFKTKPLADSELKNLLINAISHNASYNISGLLLHDKECFVQVLEGKINAIYDLMDRIIMDPRHHKIVILQRKQISKRQFLYWSMQGISLPFYYKTLCLKLFGKSTLLSPSPAVESPSDSISLARLSLSEIEELFSFAANSLQIYPDIGIIPEDRLRFPPEDTQLIPFENA